MGTFSELGKDKAAKGEGWAPPFISCAQDTVGLYSIRRMIDSYSVGSETQGKITEPFDHEIKVTVTYKI